MTNIKNRFYTEEHLNQLSQDAKDRHLDGTTYDVPVGIKGRVNEDIFNDNAIRTILL
jgi:hypothetical protein